MFSNSVRYLVRWDKWRAKKKQKQNEKKEKELLVAVTKCLPPLNDNIYI